MQYNEMKLSDLQNLASHLGDKKTKKLNPLTPYPKIHFVEFGFQMILITS